MTDRELLELAAKAAGIDLYAVWGEFGHFEGYRNGSLTGDVWDSLADDGDALRLAVRLSINIEHAETLGRKPHGVNCWPVGRGDCGHMETDLSDPYAAIRRAIVRAAAEIGRSME